MDRLPSDVALVHVLVGDIGERRGQIVLRTNFATKGRVLDKQRHAVRTGNLVEEEYEAVMGEL